MHNHNFLDHAITWSKGEIFEGRMVLIFGIVTFIVGLVYAKFGTTPLAKSMVWPVLIAGILLIGGGIEANRRNVKRIQTFEKAFAEQPQQLIQSEKERMELTRWWYPRTAAIAGGVLALGFILFMFLANSHVRSTGLVLIWIGLAILVIDYFSEERAITYQTHILEEIETSGSD